jgi:hypothetical protein
MRKLLLITVVIAAVLLASVPAIAAPPLAKFCEGQGGVIEGNGGDATCVVTTNECAPGTSPDLGFERTICTQHNYTWEKGQVVQGPDTGIVTRCIDKNTGAEVDLSRPECQL